MTYSILGPWMPFQDSRSLEDMDKQTHTQGQAETNKQTHTQAGPGDSEKVLKVLKGCKFNKNWYVDIYKKLI